MKISSPVFRNKRRIPSKYTCDGENISPPLAITDVPKEAKSLVLIVDDPDAPVGTWVHWLIWNIPVDTAEIPENSKPAGVTEGTTSFGKTGYGGPCPPAGTHRYFYKLYALDTVLDLPEAADKAILEKGMEGHIVGQGEIIGLYAR